MESRIIEEENLERRGKSSWGKLESPSIRYLSTRTESISTDIQLGL